MIAEFLQVVPFSNAKCEIIFSRVVRKKNDFRNQLNRRNLYELLQIGEEIGEFEAIESIDHWFNERVRRLSTNNHSYPEKHQHLKVVDISILALLDLVIDESQELEEFL